MAILLRKFSITTVWTLALLCECGDPACLRTVLLTLEEYDNRRPEPVVHPEHGVSPAIVWVRSAAGFA